MKPVVLCIMDGMGITNKKEGNAFLKAKKPNLEYLFNKYPHSLLEASGEFVGLPEGQMGNSEVGHMNIGAGRIVYPPFSLINNKIKTKEFYDNEEILNVITHVNNNDSSLHLLVLLSDGGVHSHINHLMALIDMAVNNNIKKLYLHLFLDGRDTLPDIGIKYLKEVEKKLKEVNKGSIATVSGRFYAMDRDNRWDRVKKAYDVIINGKGENYDSVDNLIDSNQKRGYTDEFTMPAVLDKNGVIKENDGLIVFNFRSDRLRELFKAITNPDFTEFERKDIKNLKLVTMMPISNEVIYKNAFNKEKLENTLGDYLSNLGLNQLRIAETEKYAHVTYFFDGGKEKDLKNCKRVLIPSPKVKTYDMKPEMSAYEITDSLLKELDKDYLDVVILNFANGDMVGHTGNFNMAVKAVEVVDECIGKIYNKVSSKNGVLMVTADHGNCEYMLDENNNIVTSHSTNKVPFIVTNENYKLKNGSLKDIAPTILAIMDIEKPGEMTGKSLK